MNKDLLQQLPADEQPIASALQSAVEDMQISDVFQWDLETQLMEKFKTGAEPLQGWYVKLTFTVGWAILAISAVFLLNWIIRSVTLQQLPVQEITTSPEISFEDQVRQGNICEGPLALAHNFSVSLTNRDKTDFVLLDENRTIGELRSLSWSPDGRLAIVGNTAGNGNIYLKDSTSDLLQPLLSNPDLGYLRDAAWSQDGKQLLMWSSQNTSIIYVVNADGNDLIKSQLDAQIFATPLFTPDNESIIFYGADSKASGLFEFRLDGSQTRIINSLVENHSGFAWSPDGMYLAYFIMDRTLGEALLVLEKFETGEKTVVATLPIPRGSGSSVPDAANLSWSPDGKTLVFEFGRSMTDRAIYLAYANGTELVKLADSAYSPTISTDGKCLAYISDKQVFLLDLTGISLTSTRTPVFLTNLPVGRSQADFRLDKLQWKP